VKRKFAEQFSFCGIARVKMYPGWLEAKLVSHKGWRMAVIRLYGGIGPPDGFRARQFIDLVTGLGKYDVLYGILDSAGGSPVDAWIIYEFLKTRPAPRRGSLVLITSQCGGDAVLIALGFGQILMHPGASMRFEATKLNSLVAGQQVTRLIARQIAQRAECQIGDVLGWMDKNRKFTAEECLKRSLCDAII
jgi:ATP-dependent protease ClpP protease subunit